MWVFLCLSPPLLVECVDLCQWCYYNLVVTLSKVEKTKCVYETEIESMYVLAFLSVCVLMTVLASFVYFGLAGIIYISPVLVSTLFYWCNLAELCVDAWGALRRYYVAEHIFRGLTIVSFLILHSLVAVNLLTASVSLPLSAEHRNLDELSWGTLGICQGTPWHCQCRTVLGSLNYWSPFHW